MGGPSSGTGCSAVRRHLARAALIACAALLLPALAARADGNSTHSTDRALAFTRLVHRARLRTTGATVTHHPDDRLQQAHNDCALAIVEQLHAQAHRPPPDRDSLGHALALGNRGVALTPLAHTLTRLGWPAVVRRARPGDPAGLRPPAIALLTPGHFVLVTAIRATDVEYFDPLAGHVRQPLPPFAAQLSGNSVQLSTPDD